jgi:hypothetical protein
MGEIVAFSFLILPKIGIGDSGVMIGEIAATIYLLIVLFRANFILTLSKSARILVAFLFCLVCLSSILNMIRYAQIPYYSVIYYFRTVLYLSFYVIGYRIEYNRLKSIVVHPFLINFVIMLVAMTVYYFLRHPSVQDYMWGYDFGLRMQPIFGAAIDLSNKPFYLQYIGGGSGNLLCAWAIFVFIFLNELDENSLFYTVIIAATVFLSFSRAGLLTFMLVYTYYTLRLLRFRSKAWMSILIVFGIMLYQGLFSDLPTVVTRLLSTIGENGLDPSSMGRLRNYSVIVSALKKDLSGLLIGFGFEPSFLMQKTGWAFAESFWFQILVSSGIIGLTLFVVFGCSLFKKRKKPLYGILWKYFLFQNVISWSVGGGDFLSPNNLFVIFLFLGAARKAEVSTDFKFMFRTH